MFMGSFRFEKLSLVFVVSRIKIHLYLDFFFVKFLIHPYLYYSIQVLKEIEQFY